MLHVGIPNSKVALTPVLNDTKLRNLKPQDTLYKVIAFRITVRDERKVVLVETGMRAPLP